jgi:hypothetical protein
MDHKAGRGEGNLADWTFTCSPVCTELKIVATLGKKSVDGTT